MPPAEEKRGKKKQQTSQGAKGGQRARQSVDKANVCSLSYLAPALVVNLCTITPTRRTVVVMRQCFATVNDSIVLVFKGTIQGYHHHLYGGSIRKDLATHLMQYIFLNGVFIGISILLNV